MSGRGRRDILITAALAWAIAVGCGSPGLAGEIEAVTERGQVSPAVPVASDVRLAGDDRQTRIVLDLDQKIPLRAFTLGEPYRVVLDLPQVDFRLTADSGAASRGLIKAFRYGLVMPGGSRVVFDLSGPATIEKAYVLDAANGQPARLIMDLAAVEKAAFVPAQSVDVSPDQLKPTVQASASGALADATGSPSGAAAPVDTRPVLVIDPGHGGVDNGSQASGETEKDLVLGFSLALRDRIEKAGKYRVVMTRTDDTFVPLGDRVKIARTNSAALFLSVHADALPRGEGVARGATIYTLSDKASDAEAERLAESENKVDAIGGVNLTEEPTDVADILIDLAQRETRTFSNHFARVLMGEFKTAARMHKHPLKSAGFKVLKAPDVPSVLLELGYVSNRSDLQQLVSESWRNRSVAAVAQAIDMFLARRVVSAGRIN